MGLKMPILAHLLWPAILMRKVGQIDLVFVWNYSSLLDLRVQDNKSLCAAVTIFATLVNIQTHTQKDSI